MSPAIEPGVFMRIMALPAEARRDLLEIAGLLWLPPDGMSQLIDEALERRRREGPRPH